MSSNVKVTRLEVRGYRKERRESNRGHRDRSASRVNRVSAHSDKQTRRSTGVSRASIPVWHRASLSLERDGRR